MVRTQDDKMLIGTKLYSRYMRANDLASTVLKNFVIEQIDDRDLIQSVLIAYKCRFSEKICTIILLHITLSANIW